MGSDEPEQRHLLFLVRMWPENLGDGKMEWRGQVQSAAGGEIHYFRDLRTLVDHLNSLLPGSATPANDSEDHAEQ
ncbi:MAG: hypothetical protein M1570_05590 [Chloroflexi bacterium]|nr:hypothetical protein [Chloroflexota bacterium]